MAGTSGSGKSTLATSLADLLGLPYTEIDALHHGPGWTVRPDFEADVRALAASSAWITEWQYGWVRQLLADRADLMVFLMYPRRVVMPRIVRRTVSRSWRGTQLWNGNREPPLRTALSHRDHIVRWAWRTHGLYPDRLADLVAARPELPVVVLRHPREAEAWLAGLRR